MDTTTTPFEPLLDAKEVSRLLGLHPRTILRLAKLGQLPGIRYARHWRFRRADIAAWVEFQATPTPPSQGDG